MLTKPLAGIKNGRGLRSLAKTEGAYRENRMPWWRRVRVDSFMAFVYCQTYRGKGYGRRDFEPNDNAH